MPIHQVNRADIISIHAPARGATEREDFTQKTSIISIHAPARGATAADDVLRN